MSEAVGDARQWPAVLALSPWSLGVAVVMAGVLVLLFRTFPSGVKPLIWCLEGVVVAAFLYPFTKAFARIMPRLIAMIVVFLVLIGFLGYVALVGYEEFQTQSGNLDTELDQLSSEWEKSPTFGKLVQQLNLKEETDRFIKQIPDALMGGNGASAISTGVDSLAALGTILFLAFFGLLYVDRYTTAYRDRLPPERRADLLHRTSDAYWRWFRYLGYALARGVVYGVVVGVFAELTGMPAPLILGFWFGAWSMLPTMGVTIGGLPLVLVIATDSGWLALVALIVVACWQICDRWFAQRWINTHAVHVSSAALLITGFLGLEFHGVSGVLVGGAICVAVIAIATAFNRSADPVEEGHKETATPAPSSLPTA